MKRSPMKRGTTELKRTPFKPKEKRHDLPKTDDDADPVRPLQAVVRILVHDLPGLRRATLNRATKPMASTGARAKRMRAGKVAPNAEESAWMAAIREFGCIVCFLQHGVRTPAVVHHLLSGGRRRGHLATIPLCEPGHHQQTNTPMKISRHPDKARFEAAYGKEEELLLKMQSLIGDKKSLALSQQ